MFKKIFGTKKPAAVPLTFINGFINKDKYFVRSKPWDWLNEKQIYVYSTLDGKPTMITMEFWQQEIFLYADGQITVSELIEMACKQFVDSNMQIPEDLDQALIEILNALVNEISIIEFRDIKSNLPQNVNLPMSRQLGSSS